ncbi:hypothetical protein DdX_00437 [Ditylenchus destructor]|uniref:Uncharacterized protein n=1 Tax=Ditylenchus destructor TaxID=166010 RepID=A0AAD4RD84_9BILA|nr:hypothetical protein DdX_00437 [Ditylenchus destructor]
MTMMLGLTLMTSNAQAAPLDSSAYEYYPVPSQRDQAQPMYLEPYYSPNSYAYGNIMQPQIKRTVGSAVKRERIIMDAMGGDYLIRKRTLL